MKIIGLAVFSSACLIHTMGQMGRPSHAGHAVGSFVYQKDALIDSGKSINFDPTESKAVLTTSGWKALNGPFDCVVRSFQAVPMSKAGKNLIIFHTRQQKLSRKKYNLQMDAQFGIDISDDFMANVVVAKKTPQGWKDNFFQLDAGPACSAMRKFVPTITREMAVGMKLKKHECPFPQGNYTDLALNPDLDIQSVPAFFYNVFRMRISVFNKTGVMGGFDVIIETSPKKPK